MAENHMTLEGIKNGWYLSTSLDSGKIFFYISVNTGQIHMGVETYTPEKC